MGFLNRTKSDLNLFMNRKQLRKIAFTEKCKLIIQEKMSFDEAMIQLPEFLEIIEINKGQNKIHIDNRYGKFLAIWEDNGKSLTYYEFKTRREVF